MFLELNITEAGMHACMKLYVCCVDSATWDVKYKQETIEACGTDVRKLSVGQIWTSKQL